MELDEFKKSIEVVENEHAEDIRKRYIKEFVNTKKEYYDKYINKLQEFEDGFCYTGYLWDCIVESQVVDFEFIKSQKNNLADVFVFWDIHTKERIFIKDYWKFNKNDILKLDFNTLINNLKYLPEDIYIFDQSFRWTLILTHEYFDSGRWCLLSGNLVV